MKRSTHVTHLIENKKYSTQSVCTHCGTTRKWVSPPNSELVQSNVASTNKMATGPFEPIKSVHSSIDQQEFPTVIDTLSIESDIETSKIKVASMWPSIETLSVHLQTVQEFRPSCGCCVCEHLLKTKLDSYDYCIQRAKKIRKCIRNAPFAENYRKTVLCDECRLSLNDRITKTPKGEFKCFHKGCQQHFKNIKSAINHVMDHFKLKNYCCEVCSQQFKQRSALNKHERKHLRM